ncbi:Mn-containing catalase [Burkholderia territorii]|uniref:Manganese catalase family protein n=1 Tax=Burkholderia territorii TaxID=1503055 RepID=A0A105E9H9_9BURK|nr:manganese catalase family protein [Burkholderia territorii]AOI63247.1 Mn-containing catalase [Burkholderia territorii]KAB0675022.1 manganese catalase family protein [Burkholderia territorii]KUZ45015.1 Mn-containing catalase [Burkholderia territorii]KUZ47584.1 Mn-containing catalase [Burkholderia territorii]KVG54667.1 Mn-containing catalase [Burkholderia territorii]
MFIHNTRLQYTVRVDAPNPGLANLLLEQFGGPQGELAAAMRYFTQAITEEDPGRKDMLFDIATEELSHLEVIGSLVAMLNRGAKGELAEAVDEQAELYRKLHGAGNDSHVTQLLYGAGSPLMNSGGVPWSAAYIDTIGEPTADLRSNIAAEARAKIIYERLINVTDDPGIRDALGFLMTREVSHQKSFEKALYAITDNFPPGKLAPVEPYDRVYFRMQPDAQPLVGPWNHGGDLEIRPAEPAVDGGTGIPEGMLEQRQADAIDAMAQRLASDPDSDPVTGAELGSGSPVPQDGAAGKPDRA